MYVADQYPKTKTVKSKLSLMLKQVFIIVVSCTRQYFFFCYFLQLEKQLENIGVRSQKELILLHREDAAKGFRISHTVDWLNARGWICAHHHVRLHFIPSLSASNCLLRMNRHIASTIDLCPRTLGIYQITQFIREMLKKLCTVFLFKTVKRSCTSLELLSVTQLGVTFQHSAPSGSLITEQTHKKRNFQCLYLMLRERPFHGPCLIFDYIFLSVDLNWKTV